MDRVAEDVFHIPLLARDCMNAYLLGDVLVDAGVKGSAKRILRELKGRPVGAHAVTHAHGDHVGGTKRIVEALDVPVWIGEGDADDLEHGSQTLADTRAKPVLRRMAGFEAVPVARRLREGEEIGHGFAVLDAPGHSPGHVAFWRESDRTLVAGDVWFNMNILTTVPGLHEPPKIFTPDPARNRESARRLAALEPALVLLGHGPPLRDTAALQAFTAALAA
jgi:hydroxyacylglutathione hydrolase